MKKDSLVIDGKTFISARRASEIAAYSKDYVGQLCREGKLDCRRINRLWWVNESSVRKHAEETIKANHTSFRSADAPAMSRETVAVKSIAAKSIGTSASTDFLIKMLQPVQAVRPAYAALAALPAVGISMNKAARAPSRRRFIEMSGFSVALALVFATALATASFWRLSIAPSSLTANVDSSTAQEQNLFGYVWSNVAQIFSGTSARSRSGSLAVKEAEAESVDDLSQPHAGLVVVPSQGSTTDAKMAQTITNSFSDNVTVAPAADGTSGVITPEFRTVKGHDYLYVLVPVKASTSSASDSSLLTSVRDSSSSAIDQIQ